MKKVDAEEASADPQGAQAGGTAQPIVAQRVRDWGGGTSAPSATVVAVGDAVPTHVTALAGDLILTGTEGKVRLLGVKTPDSGTDSVRAREALSKLLGDGAVKIQLTSDRTAAVVWKDGRRINESMVRLGWSRSEMYPVAEAEAKRNRDGLWRSEGWTDPGTEGCEGPSKGAPTLPKVAQNSPETKAVDNQPSKLTDPPKTAAASTGEGATSTPLDTSSVPATQLDETSLKQQPGHVLVGKGVKINTARIQPPGPAALIEGVSSNPRIAVTFNTAGEVIKAEIIRSSGNIGWDHQVQLAMKLWTAEGEEMKKGGLVIRWTVLLGAEEPACLAPGQVTEPNTAPASAIPVENRRPVVQNLVFGQGEGVQAKPDYPREAQRRRQEGAVRIRLTVDETGKVTEAEVEEPCPFPLLNQAALSTVRKHWSFPAGPKRLYITTINFILQ